MGTRHAHRIDVPESVRLVTEAVAGWIVAHGIFLSVMVARRLLREVAGL